MCLYTQRKPVQVCTLSDLAPGTEFHLPNGDAFVVVDTTSDLVLSASSTDAVVVNIRTGKVGPMYANLAMAYDRYGRFYASTDLNDWYAPVAVANEVVDLTDDVLPQDDLSIPGGSA